MLEVGKTYKDIDGQVIRVLAICPELGPYTHVSLIQNPRTQRYRLQSLTAEGQLWADAETLDVQLIEGVTSDDS